LPAGFSLDSSKSDTPPPPPGFTVDQPGDQTKEPESAMGVAEDLGNSAVRQLGRGAIGVVTFIPDIATELTNLLPGDKMELPSSYWNRQLDKVTKKPTTKLGQYAEDAGSFVVGGALGGAATAEETATKAADRGVRKLTEELKPLNRVTTKAAEEAHTAGYSLPPSYIGGGGRRTLQTVAGGPKLNKDFSASNEEVTDKLAKLSLGLHPEEDLSPETLDRLKTEAYKPYQEVRELGQMPADPEFDDAVKAAGRRFSERTTSYGGGYRYESVAKEKQPYLDTHEVDAGHTLDEIKALRASAKGNLAVYDPEKNALGYTQKEIAQAMEDRIQRYVKKVAQIHPEDAQVASLVHDLTQARSQLAKIFAVEDSMGAGGHVRADDLRRMLDNKVPLTGPLRTIAETAKNFPDAVKHVADEGKTGVWSAVDYMLGGTGILSGHPAIAGLSLARPIIRKSLMSEGTQRAMINDLRRTKGPIKKATGKVTSIAGKAIGAATKKAALGAAIITPEKLGATPDLGDSGP
jgi:hypothetical protein